MNDSQASAFLGRVAEPAPHWLPELAEAVSGQRLNANRIPQSVSWDEYARLKAQLIQGRARDLCSRWVQGFMDDRAERTVVVSR